MNMKKRTESQIFTSVCEYQFHDDSSIHDSSGNIEGANLGCQHITNSITELSLRHSTSDFFCFEYIV
jgi:hypothetical protein